MALIGIHCLFGIAPAFIRELLALFERRHVPTIRTGAPNSNSKWTTSFSDEVSRYGKKGPVSGLHRILTARLIASLASDSARANLSCDNEPSARACLARCVDACDLERCVRAAYSAGRPLVWGLLISSRHSKNKAPQFAARLQMVADGGVRLGASSGVHPSQASFPCSRLSKHRDVLPLLLELIQSTLSRRLVRPPA
jgi:hypothetical protein